MSNSIEILQNTLLQLIVRQGPDSDRLNTTLKRGELGYTTDTKRLYAGDGTTSGGILVGNVFAGSASNVTTLAPASIGDFAYDSDNKKLYVLLLNDGSNINDWLLVGGEYTADNGTIVISADNKISVGLLSAGFIDPSSVELPLYINGSDQLALSSTITVDSIGPKNASALTLFPSLSLNGINYNFPSTPPTPGSFLQILNTNYDVGFNPVALSSISTNTITVIHPLTATANGVNSTGTAINPLTANIVIGVSPTLSARNLWARYSANTNSIISNRHISTVNRTAQGHYTFTFDFTLPTSNPYANAQIYGTEARGYQARVTGVTDTECYVEVTNLDNSFLFTDADISLAIEV